MKTTLLIILFFISYFSFAQSTDDLLKVLVKKGLLKQTEADSLQSTLILKEQENQKNQSASIDLEIKPRFEYRNGYGNSTLPSSATVSAAFINQRTRMNFGHEWKGIVKNYISIQDVRIWGQHDPRGLDGAIQLFEGYIEPIISKNWSLRIGRQRLMLDNQRLFAENEWRVNAGAHDAVRIIYQNEKMVGELFGAFNQSTEKFYGTDFDSWSQSTQPNNTTDYNTTWGNQWYKSLLVGHIKYKVNENWTFITTHAADAFQRNQGTPKSNDADADARDAEHYFWRLTYGGRIEYQKENWYATFSGYNQSGDNRVGKTIKAYYLQPEIKYTKENDFTIRLGAEILSGDGDPNHSGSVDGNFDALYGVAHRFNGYMDFFTSFGTGLNPTNGTQTSNHLKNQGLINPYLFFIKSLGQKWEMGSYSHLFWTQHNYKTEKKEYDKFLGYEHDLLIKYKPNKITSIETGLSFALPTDDFAAIKGNTNNDYHTPTWAYVQLTIKPTLLKSKF
jgi:hypothetical protein